MSGKSKIVLVLRDDEGVCKVGATKTGLEKCQSPYEDVSFELRLL